VVCAAAWALSHLGSETAISALIEIKKHPDPDVRWAVANGLNATTRADAIATIIELMDDSDDNVRDWATFALGTQCDLDTPEIREALRKRLADGYEDARDEAIWGLAQRKDEYAIRELLRRLTSEEWKAGDEMAARDLLGERPDASVNELCEGLRKLQA
jgi:HEAT repeat protein